MRRTVVIADDHKLFAEGLRNLIEPEFQVIQTVDDGWRLIDASEQLKPDIILLDISMPRLNGIEATRRLRAAGCTSKLLVLSMHGGPEFVSRARSAGANGYLMKDCAPEEVLTALREVVLGREYIAQSLQAALLQATRGRLKDSAVVNLTSREREVLQLLAEGQTVRRTAEILKLTPRTVQFHRYNISEKIGLKTIAELARYALENGLVAP